MKEDPSVYDYDGVYDKMQSTKDDAPKKQPVKQVYSFTSPFLFTKVLTIYLAIQIYWCTYGKSKSKRKRVGYL